MAMILLGNFQDREVRRRCQMQVVSDRPGARGFPFAIRDARVLRAA